MSLEKEMRKIKRWLSLGHLGANENEEGQEKPGEGQQRKKGTTWGGRAGGQQRKRQGQEKVERSVLCLMLLGEQRG